jgi:hypothetical protein
MPLVSMTVPMNTNDPDHDCGHSQRPLDGQPSWAMGRHIAVLWIKRWIDSEGSLRHRCATGDEIASIRREPLRTLSTGNSAHREMPLSPLHLSYVWVRSQSCISSAFSHRCAPSQGSATKGLSALP